jgi:hypothetical protein
LEDDRFTAATALAAYQVRRLIVGGDPTARDAAPLWKRLPQV